MTDKQPDVLRLAALIEKTGARGSLRDQAASELRRQHAELETLTLYKNLADEYGLSIFPDIAEITAELETLRAKLKVYEDLGGAADDVQLLRMGYAAARLEIESLRDEVKEYQHAAGVQKTLIETLLAEKPAGAQQTGAAYAALPDFDDLGDDLIDAACATAALYRVDLMRAWNVLREAGRTMRTAQPVGALQGQGKSNRDRADAWIEVTKVLNEVAPDWALNSRTGVDSAVGAIRKLADRAMRASHGQAPAQAAPAAVAGPSGYGPKVTVKRSCSDCKACNSESYAVQGDSGHYVYCEHPSLPESKYIGDTNWNTPHWCPVSTPTTQPAPAAQGDALDAARYRLARRGQHWSVINGIGNGSRAEELDAAVDAARAAQEGKSCPKE